MATTAPAVKSFKEPSLAIDDDTIRQAASDHAPPGNPLFADITAGTTITLTEIQFRIFRDVFQNVALLANDLGYGWVGGINGANVGDDYTYVPPGTTVTGSGGYTITGPAYMPNLHAEGNNPAGDGYDGDMRTSIEFIDVTVISKDSSAGEPVITTDTAPSQITTYEVDNLAGGTPVETIFTNTVFSQSQIGAALSQDWSESFHLDFSSTQTFSAGGGMFPKASLSITESVGGSKTDGGSRQSTNSATSGVTDEHSFSHATPAGTAGKYEIVATKGMVVLPFSANSQLAFGIKIHGFLRWGGGQRFVGGTNYHNDFSGSGDRPIVDAIFGGKDSAGNFAHFSEVLKEQIEEDAAPWAWNELFAQDRGGAQASPPHGVAGSLGRTNELIRKGDTDTVFPACGAMTQITRNDVKFRVISEDAPIPS
ncbi:aerolysin family beta-barrel pore-forming toxin [Sphingomonas sp. KR3-1]|uniref:aerolysin family beta-barrel pore-forming toxin n=1 Tax=Sphingomonas sp. KR3-1 TaxID=3156611 RepID=UPI0032B488EB